MGHNYRLEPTLRRHDTAQNLYYFDRCAVSYRAVSISMIDEKLIPAHHAVDIYRRSTEW